MEIYSPIFLVTFVKVGWVLLSQGFQKWPTTPLPTKLFTSGFTETLLIYDVDWLTSPDSSRPPRLTLSRKYTYGGNGYDINYALYSEKYNSLYTVHMPLETADAKNGTVSRWDVDLNGALVLDRRQVSRTKVQHYLVEQKV